METPKDKSLVTVDKEKYGFTGHYDESNSEFSDVKELHYTHSLTRRLLQWGVEARGTS